MYKSLKIKFSRRKNDFSIAYDPSISSVSDKEFMLCHIPDDIINRNMDKEYHIHGDTPIDISYYEQFKSALEELTTTDSDVVEVNYF